MRAASDASDASATATKPFEFEGRDAQRKPMRCALEGVVLPDETRVYAAGAYAGAKTDFQIDDSGHPATTIKVAVNERDVPVALLLGAYEPTVWSVGWTRGTRIVAVVVTGYHAQRVTGLPPGTPQLLSTYDNRGPCGYAYFSSEGTSRIDEVAKLAFGRPVDLMREAEEGQVLVGRPLGTEPLVTDASARGVEAFVDTSKPLAGSKGIEAALLAGVLRRATAADAAQWQRVRAAAGPATSDAADAEARLPYNAYVVLKPFRLPAGLYGANSANFFIAKGVPLPTGERGHSNVFDLNTGTCLGFGCERR